MAENDRHTIDIQAHDGRDLQGATAGSIAGQRSVADGDVLLGLRGVSKSFGGVYAVGDATLQVRRGEVLTLLDPSSCGITTMLRLAMGLERASHREIVYGGNVVDSTEAGTFVSPHKRNMGMVFQSYAIWPHVTVAANVAYPLKARGVVAQEIRERVSRILDQLGLGGFEQRPATQLSSAEQYLVALARSLVFEPDILLLD
jgi:iron(III) transport system ATP-binding protein